MTLDFLIVSEKKIRDAVRRELIYICVINEFYSS